MSVARFVVVSPAEAHLFAPYDLRDLIKSFPSPDRRWSPEHKCWRIKGTAVDSLADALRATGCTVYVTTPDGKPYEAPGRHGNHGNHRTHGRAGTPAADWASALFAAVGPERADRVTRALAKVLHPDLDGGSAALMQQLNDARSRVTR